MRNRFLKALLSGVILVSLPRLTPGARAQEVKKENQSQEISTPKRARPTALYRVEFVVRELENGKRINARSYTMLAREVQHTRIRVGNRVPYSTGPAGQFQYQEVGMNIDFTLSELENSLLLVTTFETSGMAAPAQMGGGTTNPVFRQVRFESNSELPPGKPTVISTLDDVSTNRRYEIEVTATKVK
jgi:hypothetical protein